MSTRSQGFGVGVRRGWLRTRWSITEPYIGQIWNQSPIHHLPGMWQSGAFGDTYLCFQKWKHRELLIDESKSIPGTVWGVIIWQHFTVPTAGNVIMGIVIVHPPVAAAQAQPHSGASSVSTKGAARFNSPPEHSERESGTPWSPGTARTGMYFLLTNSADSTFPEETGSHFLSPQADWGKLEPCSGFMTKVHLGAGRAPVKDAPQLGAMLKEDAELNLVLIFLE